MPERSRSLSSCGPAQTAGAVCLVLLLGAGASASRGQEVALALRPETVATPGGAPLPAGTVDPAQSLPSAPSAAASLQGEVTDTGGAMIPGARITLSGPNGEPKHTVKSDEQGRFDFRSVPAGEYTLTALAPGFDLYTSQKIVLQPGEHPPALTVTLEVSANRTDINVNVSTRELATEELRVEEHQRVFGIFPNFYTCFQQDAAPLNTVQKFNLAAHATLDPVAFATTAMVAGAEQYNNTFPDYGGGPEGFGKRYGAAYGDAFVGKFIGSALLPSVFRQDPRYFFMGTGSVASRTRHALLSSVLARHDTGRWEPNYSHILGNAAAGALSTLYHPDSNGIGELAGRNALIGIAGGAAVNLVREFLLKPFTHGVPPSAP